MSAMALDDDARARLGSEANIWLATVRPAKAKPGELPRPHLVPIWFAWLPDAGRLYICTGGQSVKARNMQHNPQVAIALEDGSNPLVLKGVARIVEPTAAIIAAFKEKYQWDITTDRATYDVVFEIEPIF